MTREQKSSARKQTSQTTRRRAAQEPQESQEASQGKDPKGTDSKPQEKPKGKDPEKREKKPARESKSLTREIAGATIRAVEGEGNERKFILSFSSEEPYDRGWCVEILDHGPGAVNLTRLNEIGVLLFNHKRDEVLGKINRAWLENGRCSAEVEFDSDDDAEVIYKKVKSGTLKGVSVGYRIESIEEVMPGKTSADGRFTGPCDIARKWEPFEISIVSVPADPTVGVGREFEANDGQKQKRAPSLRERQLQINLNKIL